MTVTVDQVRRGMPAKAPAVEDDDIQVAIDGWASAVRGRAGESGLNSSLGELIVYLGAKAETRALHDAQEGYKESPDSVAFRNQADRFLNQLDEITKNAPPEGASSSEDTETMISNVSQQPFWDYARHDGNESDTGPWTREWVPGRG